ncbi:MAG: response regulator transcription factor, partial [Rhodocyclaceae bacterium]|nr:response regulator transcription factor [Rhodocyclaceae bacterium]
MTITSLIGKGCSNRHIARLLQVTEGTVRYHRRRTVEGAADGRGQQMPVAAGFREAIDAYLEAGSEAVPANVADLHAWLVAEHDYPAGLRSVQRYVRRAFPAPARRARRRVETPPGAQGQVDWA